MAPWFGAAALRQEPVLQDPTFHELSRLVGGEWVGSLGGRTEVHNRFTFAVDGKMIRGEGYVLSQGKTIMRTQPNLGWDPVAKHVSYVDFHNHDTVYVGHVSLEDGWLVYDFSELARPRNHFEAKSRITDDEHYEFLVGNETIRMTRASPSAKGGER